MSQNKVYKISKAILAVFQYFLSQIKKYVTILHQNVALTKQIGYTTLIHYSKKKEGFPNMVLL